ncbi:MAG: tetratricopeptide repeat protein [Deltaproteobacteria bacterium]|nr:tetratricopeptide repeat protein [Deltaproteobacteria bacterium]
MAILVLAAAACPSRALGDEGATPRAEPDREAEANAIAEEAKRRFREGDFVIALALFEKAHALDHRPDRIYNMARCCEKLGRLREAAQWLQRYIDTTADVAGRAEAQARLAEIAKLEQEAQQKSKVVALPAPATPASAVTGVALRDEGGTKLAWSQWAMLGGGALLAVGGASLWGAAALSDDDLSDQLTTRNPQGQVTGTTEAEAYRLQQRNTDLRRVGIAVGLVGLAAAAVGATWAVLTPPQATPRIGLAPVSTVAGGIAPAVEAQWQF